MMSLRRLFLTAVLVWTIVAAMLFLPDPVHPAAGRCCMDNDDCPADWVCCEYQLLKANPCSLDPDGPHYCLDAPSCNPPPSSSVPNQTF